MSPHVEIALDQLRNAEDHASTPAEQTLVFAAAAIVHACLHIADTAERLALGKVSSIPRWDGAYEQLVDEAAKYKPAP